MEKLRVSCISAQSPRPDPFTTTIPVWLCQSSDEVGDEMEDHLESEHKDMRPEEVFVLGCRACPERFDIWNEERRWREHLRTAHQGAVPNGKAR